MREVNSIVACLLMLLLVQEADSFVPPVTRRGQIPAVLGASTSRSKDSCSTIPRRHLVRCSVSAEAMEQAQAVLLSAAEQRNQEPDDVIEAIRLIERSGDYKKSIEGDDSEQPKFDLLTNNGNWRLVFTTGDVKTQKRIRRKLTYVPIKAVQVFRPDYTITNGIYWGSFPLLKFSGSFTWREDIARLEFVFDQVGVLGLKLPYKQGESKVQPGFTFLDISDRYVIARGMGGGLALWLRQDAI